MVGSQEERMEGASVKGTEMVGFVGPAWAIRVARKGLRRARRGACTSNLARFEKLGNLSA